MLRQPNHCDVQVIFILLPKVTIKMNIETFIVATELTGPAGVMVATAEKVDSEMAQMGDNATPRQQNVQALDRDSDNDVEIVEPYETPVVLKRQKKKPIPAPVNDESEAEVSELEQNQQRKRKKENKGKGRVGSFSLIDLRLA
jgi:DNA recombination-dependent growth factor C